MTQILHVEQLGNSGFPLLLLHGWGRNSSDLQSLGACLSHSSQVHLVDLPGFGQSSPPDAVWDSFQYADRIIAYLNEQGIDQIDILGHSFGGKVAASLASKYPNRVRKLVLMASSGLKRKRTIREQCRLQGIRWIGKMVKFADSFLKTQYFKERFAARFGSADYKNAGAMRSILVKSVNEDLTAHIQSIKAPTLLLWGEKDGETPPEVAQRFHQAISHSQLHLFPGKDHYLYNECGAHLCASYILPFLHNR